MDVRDKNDYVHQANCAKISETDSRRLFRLFIFIVENKERGSAVVSRADRIG